MSAINYDYIVKLIIVGDSNVGKSIFLLRFTEQNFRAVHTATIGVDFKVKILQMGNKKLKMTIWDTAGQDRFRNITTTYYKGAHGVILMYSIVDRKSFQNIKNWIKQVEEYSDKNVCKIVIGNKCDLQEDSRKVTVQQGSAFSQSYNCKFFQTSAKQNINIQETFHSIGSQMINMLHQQVEQNGVKKLKTISVTAKIKKQCEC